ncbi:uncharacterized protein LOC110706953 [Chenopodium quinoa]|uniref:Uncharacterized protein n=1 Tax=Chenopodium quinoa TaxID=63459 RepID=A0A803LQ28_CHEQI|nr:uncharacterized protein LOC110706953 [Chenopodium quinoa]
MQVEGRGKLEIKMQAMWISLNNSCRNKMNDVICRPKKLSKQRSLDLLEEDKHEHEVLIGSKVMESVISYKQTAPSSSFKEIGVGDPSRKVIEKILGDALTNPAKKISKIRNVFRVKNSSEVLEKFEKYRDMVKQKAKETGDKQPRSLVDGNELLCFYVTTMTCHSRQSELISGPCDHSYCNLCRTICSSFDMKYTKRFGVQLCTSSEALRESMKAVLKGKNSKRAVIICRIIAGRIKNTNDRASEEYDSIRNYRGFCFKSEHLIVKSPNAVLPCFVVVLN